MLTHRPAVRNARVTFISYRPFAPVIRPPNYNAAPGAAALGAAAGMESDGAQGRQRGMTGMRRG